MKLEVGMYLRTNDGKITKFIKYDDEDKEELVTEYYKYGSTIWIKDVVKASHSLLGNKEEPCLIEVGDYVNGEKVSEIRKMDRIYNVGIIIKNENGEDIYSNFRYSKYENIETILTKEQFESMAYKVND